MNHNDDGNDPYVFATMRYDPKLLYSPQNTAASRNADSAVYLLHHQWTRLSAAKWSVLPTNSDTNTSKASHAVSSSANFHQGILKAVDAWHSSHEGEQPESIRIRLRLYSSGDVTTEMWPIARIPIEQLFPPTLELASAAVAAAEAKVEVVLDIQATEVTAQTMFKTSDRSIYGRARAGALIFALFAQKEVLLYSAEDKILDASQSTPYFFRHGRWVTPHWQTGGQQGTTRRWALQVGLAIEADVSTDSLTDGEVIWLSNAVQGFRTCVFRMREGEVQQPDAADVEIITKSLQ